MDPATGRVEVSTPDGSTVKSPSDALGIQRADLLLLRIAKLYELGEQVAINRDSGSGPLDAPMKPDWFGDQASTKVGSVSRKVEYRVSLLDRKTLRALENQRKLPRALLEALSFSIANGVRWMPRGAKVLFERELEGANAAGHKMLMGAIDGSVDAFVKSRADAVVADAQAIFQQVRPGGRLRPEHISEMLDELTLRLSKAISNRFLPQVAYSSSSIQIGSPSPSVSPYGPALEFLYAIAKFPRSAKKDRGFFLRGLRLSEREVLKVMNICDDAILRDESPEWKLADRANDELIVLDHIMKADSDAPEKCRAILHIIEDHGAETVAIEFVENCLKGQPTKLADLAVITKGDANPPERWNTMFKLLEPTVGDD